MSDLSVTIHNVFDLFDNKIDFNQFENSEAAMFQKNVDSLPDPLRPLAQVALDSLKVGASSAVGIGQAGLGALVNTATDTQVTMLLNLMSAAGIPTTGPLSIAEAAALTSLINGLKTLLDHAHVVRLSAAVVPPVAGAASTTFPPTLDLSNLVKGLPPTK
jgi:hypothetical protein